jgi:ketosteroid isomerase-like protein
MSEQAAVLFANDAFYVAFTTRDLDAMNDLWAHNVPVTCVHPGWNVVAGRDAVLESWRAILANPESPEITCRQATAHVLGDVAYVVCFETIETSHLVATNVFVREDGAWRLVHHQAGITAQGPSETEEETPDRMQ